MSKLTELSVVILLATSQLISTSGLADEFKKEVPEMEANERPLAKFVIEEVIPAFGGLQSILVGAKPKFELRYTNKGALLTKCYLKIGLQQLKVIHYNIIEVPVYDLTAKAEIGASRKLNLVANCGEDSKQIGTEHLNLEFYITDQDEERSSYVVKMDIPKQGKLDLEFEKLDMEVKIISMERDILVSKNGEVIPYEANYDRYEKNSLYLFPKNEWESHASVASKVPLGDSKLKHISLEKKESVKEIHISGKMVLRLPLSQGGDRQKTEMLFPVNGVVYMTADGETVPVIDISTGE